MKFWARGLMKSSPDFKVAVKTEPLNVESSVNGFLKGCVDSVSGALDEVPIRVAIPFMKCKKGRRPPVVASVGGFKLKIDPFCVNIDGVSLNMNGVLGTGGINSSLDCKVDCKTEIDVKGDAVVKLRVGD